MIRRTLLLVFFVFASMVCAQPIIYTVEYGPKLSQPPSLMPVLRLGYLGMDRAYVVTDNWYYASRARADSVGADAFVIPGGSTSDLPFYDGRLDSYVELLRNPGRPTIGLCAGLQFLMMARGGICANRSGEHGDQVAYIFGQDEIFEGSPNPYIDRAAHSYSIADPPSEYKILATTRTCYVTFVRHLTMPLYGSQLHIERMSNPNSAGPAVLNNFFTRVVPRKFHGIAEAVGFPGEPGKVRVMWWAAKTTSPVRYQVFHGSDLESMDFTNPVVETDELASEFIELDPQLTHYFAVRALTGAFQDSNQVIFPIKPDGHFEIAFQNGRKINGRPYEGCEATVIAQAHPNSNYGIRGSLGRGTLYWWDSGLVQFKQLETFLTGKKVIGGRITFLFSGGVESNTNSSHVADIGIYRVLKNWQEGRGFDHSEARVGDVTWNSAQHNVVAWQSPGCRGAGDRSSTPLATYTIKGDGTGISFDGTVTVPPELIQTWVDHPDSNCGLLYEKTDTYPTDEYFIFEDNADEWFMNHPRLTVQYVDQAVSGVVNVEQSSLPSVVTLLPNYPNPFNGGTTIPFRLGRAEKVRVLVYNIFGQRVTTIFDGTLSGGLHTFRWNGLDDRGVKISSGVYLYSVDLGVEKKVRRMSLLR